MPPATADELRRVLNGFFSGLDYHVGIWRRARQQLDVQLGSQLNVFNYIRPDENRLSAVIADLLNPKGPHGQGDRFLRAFLRILDQLHGTGSCLTDLAVEEATVTCEATTSFIQRQRRRLDILVEIPLPGGHRFGLCIENKPWAGEQVEQLADYTADLAKRCKGGFVLCFLSRKASPPQSLPPDQQDALQKQGSFHVLQYSTHLRGWLDASIKEVEAEKVRWFLRDLREYVDLELGDIPEEEAAV